MDVETPILILGLAGLSMHHGALGIVRSAGRLGIPVFVAHRVAAAANLGTSAANGADRRYPIERSRYCCGSFRLASDGSDERNLAALRKFAGEHRGAILIAVDDASAMFVEDHSDALAEHFIFPRQPSGLVRSLGSKRELHELCLRHGIPTPSAAFPQSEADVLRHAASTAFPVVAKRIDASLPARPSAPSVLIANNPDQLLEAYRLMESDAGPNVLLQEYLPGTPEAIWMFNGYFNASSDCLAAFTGQKIRQSPPDTGAATLGVCRANAAVEQSTRRLMKAVGFRGILDIGYRWDPRDETYKLLDANPRIGATFRLFVGRDGLDVLRALYLDLTGQTVPATSQRQGRRWVVEPLDLRSSWLYLRRGDLTPGAWARSLRGVEETAWWAADDPLPFFAVMALLSRGFAGKRLGR
jgi:predicted ATP-grasp superfamily ATP-dependent carboligase